MTETIKEKLEHAMSYCYLVRLVYDKCTFIGVVAELPGGTTVRLSGEESGRGIDDLVDVLILPREEVDEKPVPWYEDEWTLDPHQLDCGANVWGSSSYGCKRMIVRTYNLEMTNRIMGIQKLVKIARWHASSGNSYQTAMRDVLKEMGVEV